MRGSHVHTCGPEPGPASAAQQPPVRAAPTVVACPARLAYRNVSPHALADQAERLCIQLAVLGPRPRPRLVLLLQGFGLTAAEAAEVLLYGLSHGLLAMEPGDLVRVVPKR